MATVWEDDGACVRASTIARDGRLASMPRVPYQPVYTPPLDAVAFDARKARAGGDEDGMERTYDLLWHDLIQHREGKGASRRVAPRSVCVRLDGLELN